MQTGTTTVARIPLICAAALLLAAPAGADSGEIVSTAKDQKTLSLTIYNNNLAMIKDRRLITVPKGASTLAFREVSARIRPETALLSGGPEVLEQNFEYDLLTPHSLLAKYVGREVTLLKQHPTTGEERAQQALVLSAGDGVVLQVDGHIETGVNGRLVYPDVPLNLRDRPTLTMEVSSAEAGPQEMELSYLSTGLTWQADYVAELGSDESTLDLNGWVTLTNESGVGYANARLQLVAGDVHVVSLAQERDKEMVLEEKAVAAVPGRAMEEEEMFEYHLYTLGRPTTIGERQKKQVALLQADGVRSRKEFILQGSDYYYRTQAGDLGRKLGVDIELAIKNEKEHGLGLPIPAGVVRVYKKDGKGFLQFVGEDRIEHTPDRETIRLHLGTAFDLSADKKQTDFKKLAGMGPYNYAYESSYELKIKNAKEEKVQVQVREPLPGDWKILRESAPHTKENAHTASWLVEVPAKGALTLTYTAQVRF